MNNITGSNRHERNGRQTEEIITPDAIEVPLEIPAITLPASINSCVSNSGNDANEAVKKGAVLLAAKHKLFKTRKTVSLQDNNEDKSNSNSTNNFCNDNGGNNKHNGHGGLNVNVVPNGKFSWSSSESVEPSTVKENKNLTSTLASLHSNVNLNSNRQTLSSKNANGSSLSDCYGFDKSLDDEVVTDKDHQDKIQSNSESSLTNPLVWSGNHQNHMPASSRACFHHTDSVSTNNNSANTIEFRTLNQSLSPRHCQNTNSSTDIQIDMYDEEEEEAEVILGLDLHNENDDEIISTANPHLKYLQKNARYSGILFPNPSYSSNNHKDICSTTSTTTTISHPTTTTTDDDCGGNSGGVTACSSIWDGINQLCAVETCPNPASKKCKSCKAAYYCSESHQKEHWKKHKTNCIPYKMETTENGKSAMVAVRNIPAGCAIFTEKPFLVFPVACTENDFVHVMDSKCVMYESFDSCTAKTPACLSCMKLVPIRHQCSRCGLPLCSEHCEQGLGHMLECQALTRNKITSPIMSHTSQCFHTLYMDVEILRALELENHDPKKWEQFLELRTLQRTVAYRHSDKFRLFRSKINTFVKLSTIVSGYNYDLICDCHAIITALSFKPALKSAYKMLIGTQVHFAHDCVPNTISYIEEQMTANMHRMRCVVKSAVTIMKGDIISIDFTPTPYLPYPLRLKTLENLNIHCECRRCTDPTELGDRSHDIQCCSCHGAVVPEHPRKWKDSVWSCYYCQEEVPYSHVNKIYQQYHHKLANIPKSRKGLQQLISFIREASMSLNKTHELVIMAWCFVETILRPIVETNPDPNRILTQDLIDDFILLDEYCNVVDEHFNSIRPGIWLDRGIVLYHKFYASFVLASNDYRKNVLPRKEFITKVMRSMKVLQVSLEIFSVYEGYNVTQQVTRLMEQALWTRHTIHEYVGRLIKEDSTFATTTANSFRRLI